MLLCPALDFGMSSISRILNFGISTISCFFSFLVCAITIFCNCDIYVWWFVFVGKKGGYLRFLYMCIPSIVSARVKPVSISFMASSGVFAVLLVHSSESVRYSADSRLMYSIVLSMFLCPSTVLTWTMSLVLWYSIVPFQCRKVWKCMFLSLGLLSLSAWCWRRYSRVLRRLCLSVWKTLLFIFGVLLSMAISLLLIGRFLLLHPFSAVI